MRSSSRLAGLEGDIGSEEAPVELHPPQRRFDLVQDLERLMVVRLFELLVGLIVERGSFQGGAGRGWHAAGKDLRHELEDGLELLVLGLYLLGGGLG